MGIATKGMGHSWAVLTLEGSLVSTCPGLRAVCRAQVAKRSSEREKQELPRCQEPQTTPLSGNVHGKGPVSGQQQAPLAFSLLVVSVFRKEPWRWIMENEAMGRGAQPGPPEGRESASTVSQLHVGSYKGAFEDKQKQN